MRIPAFFMVISLSLFQHNARSQESNLNVEFLNKSLVSAREVYLQDIGDQLQIYNGKEYAEYDRQITGHPFYLTDYYEYGVLEYDGNNYDSVEMRYDIHKDALILKHFTQSGFVKEFILNDSKITRFYLLNRTFIVIPDSSETQPLETGIYELLFHDELYLLSKRSKKYVEEFHGVYLKQRFEEESKYYILNNDQLSSIRNKRSLIKAFPEQKKGIKKHIRDSRLYFGNDLENSIISTVRYVSTLKE